MVAEDEGAKDHKVGGLGTNHGNYNKIKCYTCDELGYRVKDCPQLRDWMNATAVAV